MTSRAQSSAWLQLLRPANIATALADVLAGASIAGVALGTGPPVPSALGWQLAATCCLYAGGIVLNDVFDRHVDAVERPERPIPSGRISSAAAAVTGTVLLASGIVFAAGAGRAAGVVAVLTTVAILTYDAWAKRHDLLGPVAMGLCRALNLMLGVAVVPAALEWAWPLAFVPMVYIASVTAVSRGEVHGGQRRTLRLAVALALGVLAALSVIVVLAGTATAVSGITEDGTFLHTVWAMGVLAWLGWRLVPALLTAARTLSPADVRRAVRTGVLSLVLVDAVLAAAYAGIINSLAVLAAGLLAGWLSRLFAVT